MAKILASALANPASLTFSELQRLAQAAGFQLARVTGSHHVYKKAGVPEIIDLQPKGKDAKAYQVRQVIELIERYKIGIE